MSFPNIFNKIWYLFLLSILVSVWLILGMVWFDRFIPPFNSLEHLLTPWKGLFTIPFTASQEKRLSIMQELLAASNSVANYAFLIMMSSFTILSGYLSFAYQQKQRRAQENRLLILKNQEIARRNEFIRYISATIGHEFKNNLGRIKRRIDLLPDLPQDVRLRMDGNLEKLFADIEIFKKISDEREAGLMNFTNVNIGEMLMDIARQYGDLADFNFQGDMHIPPIFASQPLLKTVFENLIDNSVKYKKPEQPRAHISVSYSTDIDGSRWYVSLLLRDEGIGMDEQQAEHCFYKGKGTSKGWGEGLYYTKYVIGLHAGKIRVGKEYTSPGKGTEIIINLPFVKESLNV